MGVLFLLITIGLLWLNLVGAGLAAWQLTRDYATGRVAGVLTFCLASFFLEHFWGWGPRPVFLPVTTLASAWLVWQHRDVLRASWHVDAWFAAGFLYCFAWRFAFPDIDITSDRMPSLMMVDGYMNGNTLPSFDRWLSPYRSNFYYSFQQYSAALFGRSAGISAGLTYHLAYATLAGYITMAAALTVERLCAWRWGRRLAMIALLLGGSGAIVVVHATMNRSFFYDEAVNFLGGTIVRGKFNDAGAWLSHFINTHPDVPPRDLPMPSLSYVLVNGDYHPPLSGYILLTFAALLIATMETAPELGRRRVLLVLLGATVPIAIISNAWIFPLQAGLVAAWLGFRYIEGEKSAWLPAAGGAALAFALEFPYLREFMQQGTATYAAIRWTETVDHSPWLGWLVIFWPVVGIILLGFWNRDRRRLALFLMVLWTGALFCTEFLYNDDLYGGQWNRFNTSMKWWPWVYAGTVLTLGALNLGARSWFCRWGTVLMLLPTCVYGIDLARVFVHHEKPSLGRMDGHAWLERDPVVREMLVGLENRPDGVTVESGLKNENTESPAVALFAHKQSLLGWPWHESLWRGTHLEIESRSREIEALYSGTLPDPASWLIAHNVRYILWLPRDNLEHYKHLRPLIEQVRAQYTWVQFWSGDENVGIGFFERNAALPPAK